MNQTHPEYQYINLIKSILDKGNEKSDRTGTGTLSTFVNTMRFPLSDSFPLLTTKKVFSRGIFTETLWFLSGDTNVKTLQDQNVHFWDGNSSREYLDSIGLTDRKEGDLGPVYGFQWRHCGAEYVDCHTDYKGKGIDQIANAINIIKKNPTSRRIIVSAWNPNDLDKMALPPCHSFFQFYVENDTLSCHLTQRSGDVGLGIPFNIASYSLLTCMIAQVCQLKRGEFIITIGDAHIYKDHIDALTQQIKREPFPFCQLKLNPEIKNIDDFTLEDIKIENYKSHNTIKMKMSV